MVMAAAPVRRYATKTFSSRAFVAEQERRYEAIWRILGWNWENWFFAAALAVNSIPGPEHGQLNPNFSVTDEQRDKLLAQLKDMGWFKGLRLRPGTYDYLLIMGAKYRAMVVRAVTLRNRLEKVAKPNEMVTFQNIFGLSGQRPREDKTDGTVEEIYANLSDEVRAHEWVKAQMLLMQDDNANELFGGAFATEFELMVLSILVAYDGAVQVGQFVPCNDMSLPGVPTRTTESCTLILPDGSEVLVINAPAVERPYGPPRPTSISTTRHLIEHYGIIGGTVVVITVRVHGRRIVGDSERTIHAINPSILVIGYTESIDSHHVDYFPHALAESVNQLVNAVQEVLNDLRPTGAPMLDLKTVRKLLDRLHQTPTQGTLMGIIAEAMTA